MTEQQKEEMRNRFLIATENAKRVLVTGDRLRVTKCPGTKRWITFARWDGNWIISKSGIDDFAACAVDMVNATPVNFGLPSSVSSRS
jgi:hypothetical protein